MWEIHIHSVFITGFMDPFHHRGIWAKLMKDLVLYHMMEGLLWVTFTDGCLIEADFIFEFPLFLLYV